MNKQEQNDFIRDKNEQCRDVEDGLAAIREQSGEYAGILVPASVQKYLAQAQACCEQGQWLNAILHKQCAELVLFKILSEEFLEELMQEVQTFAKSVVEKTGQSVVISDQCREFFFIGVQAYVLLYFITILQANLHSPKQVLSGMRKIFPHFYESLVDGFCRLVSSPFNPS